MPLTIVRNDITKMEVDAIVNSTNEQLKVGGYGVDASIHYAAGPELADALRKIGYCPTGSCVATDSFGISNCRFIFHAVGPVHQEGLSGQYAFQARNTEYQQLKNCYRAIFALAKEKGCKSIALPLISAGANQVDKYNAYSFATSEARAFLRSLDDDEEMMIYLVLYGSETLGISRMLNDEVRQYISEADVKEHRQKMQSVYDGSSAPTNYSTSLQRPTGPRRRPEPRSPLKEEREYAVSSSLPLSAPLPCASIAPSSSYEDQDLSFAEMCEWWCREKKISKHTFYTRSNISRAAFWNLKNKPEQAPRKTTVLACAIGLKLDIDQTEDLLKRAGLVLSPYYALDRTVEYFIIKKRYNIDEINAVLYDNDLLLLGSSAK